MDAQPADRPTVNILQACKLAGVSRRTIYNWLAAGKLEYLRTAGGSVRIVADSLWRRPEQTSHPIKTTLTGEALTRALERQKAWTDQHGVEDAFVAPVQPAKSATARSEQLRMAVAVLRSDR